MAKFFFNDDNDGFNDNYDDNFGKFDDNYDKNDKKLQLLWSLSKKLPF